MKKYPYFAEEDGLSRHIGDIKEQMRVIAYRYVGDNAPLPYTVRRMPSGYFRQERDGSYVIDLREKLGKGEDGYALAAGAVKSQADKRIPLSVSCMSPCRIWLNDEEVFRSTFQDEIHTGAVRRLEVTLKKGINVIHLLARRTRAGFGCRLFLPPIPVFSPLPEAEGMAGWAWTDLYPQAVPALTGGVFADTLHLNWHPEPGEVKRPETAHVAWSRLAAGSPECIQAELICRLPSTLFVNGEAVCTAAEGRRYVELRPGRKPCDIHIVGDADLILRDKGCPLSEKEDCPDPGRKNSEAVPASAADAGFASPVPVIGSRSAWLYAPLEGEFDYRRYTSLYEADWLGIRLFYEGTFSDINWVKTGGSAFGSWNYPIGVTLQGLLRTAEACEDETLKNYALAHMDQCLDSYDYVVRDAKRYGATTLNPELVELSMLDHFGSMASAMLACRRFRQNKTAERLSELFWDFIRTKLSLLPDGTMYRKTGEADGVDTIWADDLYMGTSFLRRYWETWHAEEALDMAAAQFTGFVKYLLLPEKVFSHVYDLTRKTATGIPWGRGNGWVLFSLSELLEAMPQEHKARPALLELYRTLCEGIVKLQDERGFWHQVLTDPEAYEEVSCTAMFTYAISKGLRLGWFSDAGKYFEAAGKGWSAIAGAGVDREGNVYAVCKGSGFSFTKEYYKEELFWVTNDNHGVGIVLLAAAEYRKLLYD